MVSRNLLRFRIKIHRVLLPWIYLVWIIWSFYPIIDILTIRLVAEKRKGKHGIDYVIFQLVRILKFKNLLYLSKWTIRVLLIFYSDWFFFSLFSSWFWNTHGWREFHAQSYILRCEWGPCKQSCQQVLFSPHVLLFLHELLIDWSFFICSSGFASSWWARSLEVKRYQIFHFLCTVIFMHCNCGSLRTFSHYNINVFLCLVFAWLYGHL